MFGVFRKPEPIRERGVQSASEKRGLVKVKESYEKIRKIGQGGQGSVWIVKRKSDKKILVRKEQKDFLMHGDIPCEMHLFEHVLTKHPSIIKFHHANYTQDTGSLVLYFEHCQGGDLSKFIPREGARGVSEAFMWHVFIQLADALAFLHYGWNRFAKDHKPPRQWKRIVHADIKPENVFLRRKLTADNPVPDIVLGDFGLATLDEVSYGGGTYLWIGPEIPKMTKQNDVWAVGSIIHALAYGQGPVSRPPRDWPKGEDAELRWSMHPGARQPKQLTTAYSSALNRNMMDCLAIDPKRRINSRDLLENLLAQRPATSRKH